MPSRERLREHIAIHLDRALQLEIKRQVIAHMPRTGGPHFPRNSRTAISLRSSLTGGGSGIHKFNWNEPLLPALNSDDHCRIPSGCVRRAPIEPMPPAFATATAKLAGHANPAISLRYYTHAVRGGEQAVNELDKAYAL